MSSSGSQSPSRSLSPTLHQSLNEFRVSTDSERPSSPSVVPSSPSVVPSSPSPTVLNGKARHVADDAGLEPLERVQRELERTKEEKDKLAAQYQNLLAKLTTMRTTLGNKLKQDAEELDRREQLVQQLTAQNDDLSSTLEALQAELLTAHADIERASSERDTLARGREVQEGLERERELREALERCRMERDEWERAALGAEELADLQRELADLRRELELEREGREKAVAGEAGERERAANLQAVLEDFQAAKEHEMRAAVGGYERRLEGVTGQLAEYKHRALTAEMRLEELDTSSSRTAALEKEVSQNNHLISKLRHEAVILNEHLTEALRRLRRSTADTNVDRRLVTNIVLQFLAADRADPKRFEMLALLAGVLGWGEAERARAGLVRSDARAGLVRGAGGGGEGGGGGGGGGGGMFWGGGGKGKSKGSVELEKTDETESFSRLWVEFLLTEAASGSPEPPHTPTSLSNSNNSLSLSNSNNSLSSAGSPKPQTRRLFSAGAGGMASTPDLARSARSSSDVSRSGSGRASDLASRPVDLASRPVDLVARPSPSELAARPSPSELTARPGELTARPLDLASLGRTPELLPPPPGGRKGKGKERALDS
ncbi:hypothetical protein PLICRDRAFT_42231 [Plicaturopsis crispa FD-325 SS-3]|nr:hypothetical protein PLICRDRAFT_42231 [Plicaturopsis crispa FD-325 SS-3]